MEKLDYLTKEEFIKFVEFQARTIKVYFEEEESNAPFQVANVLMYNGLEKIVVPHIISREDKLISFGSKFLKIEEWEVFFNRGEDKTYSIVVRTASGMFVDYNIPFLIERFNHFQKSDLNPCLSKLVKRFFTLIHSMLYNTVPKDLLATEEELLAHKGVVDLSEIK